MKIAIINESRQTVGGGWTFIANLRKGLGGRVGYVLWQEADVCLIPSASMVSKELFRTIKAARKKIVLRIDNIPRNSRNRGTGTTRLYEFAQGADEVVYQSKWAQDYVGYFTKKAGEVICNGIDTDVFRPEGQKKTFHGEPVYLYSRYNRDETKRWEYAWYRYQLIQRENPKAILVIVGQFSEDLARYSFDFFCGERFVYLGVIDSPEEMAATYRGCDFLIACYSNDCYSNTYLEALACGVKLFEPDLSGGTPELLENWKKGREFNGCERMAGEYLALFEKVVKT